MNKDQYQGQLSNCRMLKINQAYHFERKLACSFTCQFENKIKVIYDLANNPQEPKVINTYNNGIPRI